MSESPSGGDAARFEALLAAARDQRPPPVERWNPPHCGSIDIRIDADGNWHHEGAPIRRPELVRLFAGILRRDEGAYYLVTPVEKLRIRVDDAPFIAVDMESSGTGAQRRILLRTNVGDAVAADAEHPIVVRQTDAGPRPYATVRRGLTARIARSVFYRLAELATREGDAFAIYSGGARFVLGTVERDRAANPEY